MAINNIDDFINGLANNSKRLIYGTTFSTPEAGVTYHSGWQAVGVPGGGANPPAYNSGGPYTCSSGTVGAMPYINAVNQNYLARFSLTTVSAYVFYLADRLWACSVPGNAGTGVLTVTTPGSMPARITDNGHGCEIWIEQYVAPSPNWGAGNFTVNYLDTAGNPQTISLAVLVSPNAGHMRQMFHATGAAGVSQITSVQRTGTGTTGTWGVTVLKRVAELQIISGQPNRVMDWAEVGLAKIPNDACLMFFTQSTGATAPFIYGTLDIVDK